MVNKVQDSLDELSSSPSQFSDVHPGMASKNYALAQAIVADLGFISALSSSFLEKIRPDLFKSLRSSISAEVPMGLPKNRSAFGPKGFVICRVNGPSRK